jgi:hypothetical protein
MTSRGGEALVPGEQRRGEGFGEGDVYSIIGRQIVPQFPDPRQKQVVRIPAEGEVDQIGEHRASTIRIELAGRRIPANDPRHFDIDQMECVHCLSRDEQPPPTASAADVRSSTSSIAEASTTIIGCRARRERLALVRRKALCQRGAPDAHAILRATAAQPPRESRSANSRKETYPPALPAI